MFYERTEVTTTTTETPQYTFEQRLELARRSDEELLHQLNVTRLKRQIKDDRLMTVLNVLQFAIIVLCALRFLKVF